MVRVRVQLQPAIWLSLRPPLGSIGSICSSILMTFILLMCGCVSSHNGMDIHELDWIHVKNVVMLRSPSGVEAVQERWLEDRAISVGLALTKPDSSRRYSGRQLAVYVSVLAQPPIKDLSMTVDKAYLQVGEDRDHVHSSKQSRHHRYMRSPYSDEEVIMYFELGHLDSIALRSEPIVIYLDSIVTFNQQLFDLGRIRLDSFSSDTADYIFL